MLRCKIRSPLESGQADAGDCTIHNQARQSSHLEQDTVPFLVAHRGYPACYPENSLPGITAALKAGACFVEFDIQLTADGIPVVLHDQTLLRTGGIDIKVTDTGFAALRQYSTGEPDRFGNRFADVRLPSLQEVAAIIQQWPQAHAFIELKRCSLQQFGPRAVVEAVLGVMQPILAQCIVISFDRHAVRLARDLSGCATGWVADRFDDRMYRQAEELSPDFMFFDHDILPSSADRRQRQAPWDWVVYVVNEPDRALELGMRGIRYVETDTIGDLLMRPLLGQKRCSDPVREAK